MSKERTKQTKLNFTFNPWVSEKQDGAWIIKAYSLVAGKYEVIATIKDAEGFPANQTAQFIVDNINLIEKRECLIAEMTSALEMCLESEDGKLNWSAEHDAEVALRHAREKSSYKK